MTAFAHDGHISPGPEPPRLAQGEQVDPAAAREAETCPVVLTLVDAETGKSMDGLVRITTPDGKQIILNGLLPRTAALSERSLGESAFAYMNRWSVVVGRPAVRLPRGPLVVEAFHGLDTELTRLEVDFTSADMNKAAHLRIPLRRFAHFQKRDYYAGNAHLHLKDMTLDESERYATEIARTDGYDIVFFSYLERAGVDHTYISNTFTQKDLRRFSKRSGVVFGYGEEYRNNLSGNEGYGHVMFLDLDELILPASFGRNIMKHETDDGALRDGIVKARDGGATTLWCHNMRGFEDIPNFVGGFLDGQIIFESGSRGFYEDSIYRYMNIGLMAPISTGTDWFNVDMALTYVRTKGRLNEKNWLRALREGKSFISNGPLLELTVNGKALGDTVDLAAPSTIRVRGKGIGRADFDRIELIWNGNVIEQIDTRAEAGHFEAELDAEWRVETPGWFALRVPPFAGSYDKPSVEPVGFNEYGKPLFAHTSAIYVTINEERVFKPDVAQGLIDEMQRDKKAIIENAVFSDDDQRDHVLTIYDEAVAQLKSDIRGK